MHPGVDVHCGRPRRTTGSRQGWGIFAIQDVGSEAHAVAADVDAGAGDQLAGDGLGLAAEGAPVGRFGSVLPPAASPRFRVAELAFDSGDVSAEVGRWRSPERRSGDNREVIEAFVNRRNEGT